ncbi:DUF1194 domain-containing protein [Pikeienuella piscinae]|uniref:DUF1194 domain-containing protein n=1 Tax=Pikeienuella piscinae TaxID=2748098 RepID=A0A7L5BX88_9RHOB|nr:DUF1194 domain-containing protein [Pikeienuella piscinae]QIE56342.1 DUF1194 domain-containing protein [Pikeienuella piscinae]
MRALVIPFLLCAGQVAAADIEVDVELVLAVDVSRSMTARELEIQRRGYAEALASQEVIRAIEDGLHGRIALTYMEWAGEHSQRFVVDWTLIENRVDAETFAARISAHFDGALRRTSISGAIDRATASFENNGFAGLRRVIDISGDGPNNQGRPAPDARDAALARGVAINGLPLMTREGMGSQWNLETLDEYYRRCVTGGPTSFVIPVLEWRNFPAAVRRKLVLELVDRRGATVPAQFTDNRAAPYDCLVGERIWERLRDGWNSP